MFPIHAWGLIQILQDLEFVNDRTEMWDAVGYASYSILFLFIECAIIALLFWALSLLLPKHWDQKKVISVVSVVYFSLIGASIVDFLTHVFSETRISKQYMYGLENFTVLTYTLIIAAFLLVCGLCIYLILKTEKGERFFEDIFGRITVLSYLFLAFDFAGLVIVLLRNFSETL